MIQPDLLERVRRGDPEAIALLLNHTLKPRGVTAKVQFKDGCLQILLTSNRPLDQRAFVAFIRKQVGTYEPEGLRAVKVYGQQLGEEVPSWHQEFVPIAEPELALSRRRPPRSPLDQSEFLRNLRSFQLAAIFPYHEVLGTHIYSNNTVKLLLFFGLFPLLVDLFTNVADLEQTAWLLGIYYACIWGVVLYDLIKPPKFSWSNTLQCVLFTSFVGIPILLFFQQVPPFSLLYAAIKAGFLFRLVGFVFGVGVLEELCKSLPVYFFLMRAGKLDDPLSAAFYGSMSGLGFAIAEGATYSLVYGFGLVEGRLDLDAYVVANTIRFVSLPLFHAILAGIVGYFIGLAAINPARQGAILFIGVAIAATIHGLYNTFAGSIAGLLMIGFSILLFTSYLRRSKELVSEMQRAERGFKQ